MLAILPLLGYPGLRPTFFRRNGGVLKACLLERVSLETVYHFQVEDPYNTARPCRFLSSKLFLMCTSQEQ